MRKFVAAYRPDLLAEARVAQRPHRRTVRPPRRRPAGDRRQGARPAAVVLHRLSGAADLRRHEAGRARARRPSRELRHRLPPVLGAAAVQPRQCHDGLRTGRRRRRRVQYRGERASARSRSSATAASGTTGLASSVGNAVFNKSDNVMIVVDNGYAAATGGQDVLSSAADNTHALDQKSDREGGARRRRQLGAHAHPDLRRRQDARHAERGAHHGGEGPEGDHRAVRMHAEQAAARAAAPAQAHAGRRARGARALRRRRRHLHRRPFLHPALGLPLAHARAQSRSAAARAGHQGDQFLRRLRAVRRGRACRGAVPVVLPRLDHRQSDPLGPPEGTACAAR